MSIEQTVTRVREDGWAVVRGIIPGDDVTGVSESVLATVQEADSGPPEWKRRVEGSFFTVNQSLAPYVSDRRIVGVAEALWGRHVKITVTTPVVRYPRSKPQGWHSDWPFNQKHAAIVEAPYPDTPMLLTVIFMLSPFTEENGGTWLVPGKPPYREQLELGLRGRQSVSAPEPDPGYGRRRQRADIRQPDVARGAHERHGRDPVGVDGPVRAVVA